MPWPYLSARGKSRPTSNSANALPNDEDGLIGAALEEQQEDGRRAAHDAERRATSLDTFRPSLNTLITPLTPSSSASATDKQATTSNKARRSSFPRLALPSWRQSPSSASTIASTPSLFQSGSSSPSRGGGGGNVSPSKSASIRSSKRRSQLFEEEEEGVELQEGYGTPYTATGLKGGFQCISPQASIRSSDGSASISSTSSSSRRSANGSTNLFSLLSSNSSNSRKSDEYSLDTQPSSIHSYSSSPIKDNDIKSVEHDASIQRLSSNIPTRSIPDSGFADFGPHTIVEEEERKKAEAKTGQLGELDDPLPSSRYHSSDSDNDEEGETSRDGGSNVTIPKKARSRGWFSFNSNKNDTSNASNSGAVNADKSTSTPKNERGTSNIISGTVSIADSTSTSSTVIDSQPASTGASSTTPNNTPKKIKQSASSKGMNMIRSAGRKRGDSEVSMKDMTSSSFTA